VSDPFDTLGLEPRFELASSALESRQRDLSRALHPDRHASSGAAERRQALSRAIEVNDAVRVLKNPLRRADALLRRHGVLFDERDPGAQDSPAILMEVLEQREELTAALRSRNVGEVERLAKSFQERESALLAELAQSFAALPKERAWQREEVAGIAQKLGELRYVERLLAEAHSIQDELL
jgi:molecular chaperone HscB